MRLSEWLQRNGTTPEALGQAVGVTGEAVRRYCVGARMPEADIVERIAASTGGAVTVVDLHEARVAWLAINKQQHVLGEGPPRGQPVAPTE